MGKSDITPALRGLLAEQAHALKAAMPDERVIDPVIAEIEGAAAFLDLGFRDNGKHRPSALMIIGYCAVVTSSRPGAPARARDLARSWMDEARRRWRAGCYASPFGKPVERSADHARPAAAQ